MTNIKVSFLNQENKVPESFFLKFKCSDLGGVIVDLNPNEIFEDEDYADVKEIVV